MLCIYARASGEDESGQLGGRSWLVHLRIGAAFDSVRCMPSASATQSRAARAGVWRGVLWSTNDGGAAGSTRREQQGR